MKRIKQRRQAFTLVEVTLAIGVAAFSLLAIFGLLPVGINTSQAASEQTGASNVLSAILADLRSTPTTIPSGQATVSTQFNIAIPANPIKNPPAPTSFFVTAEGDCSSTLTATSHYRVVVTFMNNGTAATAPVLAKILIYWPAVATPSATTSAVEQFVVLDRN